MQLLDSLETIREVVVSNNTQEVNIDAAISNFLFPINLFGIFQTNQ